jgi:hypothetical protein
LNRMSAAVLFEKGQGATGPGQPGTSKPQ